MKSRSLIWCAAVLLAGAVTVLFLWWYSARPAKLPAFSREDVVEATRKHALQSGEAQPASSLLAQPLLKPSARVRLAVGGLGLLDSKRNDDVADSLVAALSSARDLELVERASLDRILRESELTLSGVVRAKDAIQIGKLLRADWFLFGSHSRAGSTNAIVARVVDVRTGVIRDVQVLAEQASTTELASALAEFVRNVRRSASFKTQVKIYLAIGEFADVSVNTRQASFPSQLRSYLMGAYAGYGTTVLEREYVEALLQEVRLDLAGLAKGSSSNASTPFQSAFWIVEGYFQSYETTTKQVEVAVRVHRVFEPTRHLLLRGDSGEAFFREVKAAIDTAIQKADPYPLSPTRSGEIRIQMAAGKELFSLASGGQSMAIMPRGFYNSGFHPQARPLRRRSMEAAIRAFQTVLLLDPQNLEAKFDLAMCCHDESIARYDDCQSLLRELASSTNYYWCQSSLLSLGAAAGNHQEASKWFDIAVHHADNTNDAGYAKQLLNFAIEGSIESQSYYNGTTPKSEQLQFLVSRLCERIKSAENVMRGRGGNIDCWYGLHEFADSFGRDKKLAAERINETIPMLKTNFPALVPHLLAAAVSLQVDTNGTALSEFRQALNSVRSGPQSLLSPRYFFENMFLSTYEWCMDHEQYSLGAELVETKRQVTTNLSNLKFDTTDKVRLGFAYLKDKRWSEALSLFEELGSTPVSMGATGPWGRAFTPVLPQDLAAECRSKMSVTAKVEPGHDFNFRDPLLRLEDQASFLAEPDGVWVAVGRQLLHLDSHLDTNLVATFPASAYIRPTAICAAPEALWIATAGDGLFRYDRSNGKFRQLTEQEGLLLNDLSSLFLARGKLWLGFGRETIRGESAGGFGCLDTTSFQITIFTSSFSQDSITSSGPWVDDPPRQPPRHPVAEIGCSSPDEILMLLPRYGVRRFRPQEGKWDTFERPDGSLAYCFAADSEHIVLGLTIPQIQFELISESGNTTTNCANSTEFQRLQRLPGMSQRIKSQRMVWRGGLALRDVRDREWETIGGDGSFPESPSHLALNGSLAVFGGSGSVGVFDLKTRKISKLCYIRAESIRDLQASGDYVWAEFNNGLYRTALRN